MTSRLLTAVACLFACNAVASPASELKCMADNLHHEAKVDGMRGLEAVAAVVMNRVRSKRYPNTVCKVVYQRKQFSWTLYKSLRKQRIEHDWQTLMVAHNALNGWLIDKTGGATHYHALYVTPYWATKMSFTVQVETHLFYKENL